MLTRHVIGNPRFAAAAPSAMIPDIEVEGADLALGVTDEDGTSVVVLFSAEGAARTAEIILRTLHRLGHTEAASHAIQQSWLDVSGGDPTATLQIPKNTVRSATFLPH